MCCSTFLKSTEIGDALVSPIADESLPGQASKLNKIDWKKVSAVALLVVGLLVLSLASIFAAGIFGAGVMYTFAGGLLIFSVLPLSGSALLFFHYDSA